MVKTVRLDPMGSIPPECVAPRLFAMALDSIDSSLDFLYMNTPAQLELDAQLSPAQFCEHPQIQAVVTIDL